jgi:predicted hydrocarbon binding protein/KaiC/GvpD/RAD55 family RecA-like ATPase
LQEVPPENLILLVGPPGSGKSTFCQQAVLSNIEMMPVIYVTTELGPSKIEESLREMGLGGVLPHPLGFVDAFHETVGLPAVPRQDTVDASSEDLTSLGIAISRQNDRIKENSLLVFDSLTSPYLMSGAGILRFIRRTLLRLAAEGNAVLACIDEGCGKEEDLVAMMSVSSGVIRIEAEDSMQLLRIVKHPRLRPARIEVPMEPMRVGLKERVFNPEMLARYLQGDQAVMRGELGDFVNLLWPNLAHWSGMLWDPERFPMMVYEMNKDDGPSLLSLMKRDEALKRAMFPLHRRLFLRLMPKSFSRVKDMKKLLEGLERSMGGPRQERSGIFEYLVDASKTDEHLVRLHECSECWGFEGVDAAMAFYTPPGLAGMIKGFEGWKGLERDWNAVETKCIGLGDPYCEFKFVPGEIDGLQDSLRKDVSAIERIHQRLMHHLMENLLHGKPLLERPRLGGLVSIHRVTHAMVFPALAGERYRMVLGMGGARTGKQLGASLMEAGLGEDEAVKRVLGFLNQSRVGSVSMGETVRIKENCESSQIKLFTTKEKVPSCYFTTGFLNGFFSAVRNLHVRETKCIAMGDPYCEWEFR